MVLYADVYITVNFIIDFMLLCITAHFMKYEMKLPRIASSSAVASLLSLITVIFSYRSVSLLSTVYIPAVMLFVAFGKKSAFQFAESYIILFGTAFATGGIFKALSDKYINLSPVDLFLVFTVVFMFCFLYFDIFSIKKDCQTVEITIKSKKGEKNFSLLCDSGCLAKEPISGLPVILLSPKGYDSLYKPQAEQNTQFIVENKVRLIPIKTVSGSAIIEAVIPDRIICKYHNKEFSCKAAVGRANEQSFAGTDGIFPTCLLT